MTARKRWTMVLVVLAMVVAIGAGMYPFARHWAAYNGERVIGHRDATGRFIVTGMSSTDGRQLLMTLSCSPEYVKQEYEKSKDINVYAVYLFASRYHPMSTSELQREVDKGANTENTIRSTR